MIEIPYNVQAREETGLYNAKLGVWIFLASEIMLFGGLFSAYILLRIGSPVWPPSGETHLSIPLATLNTFNLILSSWTVVKSWVALKENDFAGFKKFMGITLICSIVFLVIKYFEYSHKIHLGIYPSTDNFFGIYYTMTGLHGLHIIGGLILNFYLWGPGAGMWKTEPERFTNRVEVAGLYWHFVDLVWIFLFPVLYLLN
ncbi:MAG: heme-copper oxidase subunit III [Candidatus Marinimicrobia bacterium]|nr:heme-copper oxidase subunit III [Candidatus Neomarinimicrobiota bacterium]